MRVAPETSRRETGAKRSTLANRRIGVATGEGRQYMKAAVLAALIAVLVISSAPALGDTSPAPSSSPTFPPAGMQFEKPFLDYLIPAIKQTGKPARIYYNDCP